MTPSVRAALRRAALVAVTVWVVLSVAILATNVVFPHPQSDDDGVGLALGYLAVFVGLVCCGILAARAATSWRIQALAGAVAGALIGALTAGTFFAMDNLFLSTIAQQQTKIAGLAHSGMSSMREYLNTSLLGALVAWTLEFAVLGAGLAAAGGAVTGRRQRTSPPVR